MQRSHLENRLCKYAQEFVLELYPHARREGNLLIIEDGVRVWVDGVKKGVVEINGAEKSLLDLALRAKAPWAKP